MAVATSMGDAPVYPVRLTFQRPDTQSKLLNLPLLIGTAIRIILLVPNLLVLIYFIYPVLLAWFVSLWGILFTGRYPRGLFKLQVGVMRWYMNVTAYTSHLVDEYPPMDLDARPETRVQLDVDYPTAPSRWLNLPFLPIKFILVIPNLLVLYLLGIVAGLLGFIATFAILFTGSYPEGLYNFVAGYLRWSARFLGYMAGFTDKYPPFSLD